MAFWKGWRPGPFPVPACLYNHNSSRDQFKTVNKFCGFFSVVCFNISDNNITAFQFLGMGYFQHGVSFTHTCTHTEEIFSVCPFYFFLLHFSMKQKFIRVWSVIVETMHYSCICRICNYRAKLEKISNTDEVSDTGINIIWHIPYLILSVSKFNNSTLILSSPRQKS